MSFPIVSEIDVRTITPQERHKQIFGSFDGLQVGQSLVIVSDHNPVPLHLQLNSRAPGQVDWNYLESGPQVWRVQIGKLQAPAVVHDSCCGGCGGSGH
jgi:uncharacterized protein (DUF2249 family)